MKISGVINTYNEERDIISCLKSIDWLDEIIIIDMGSTDNTLKLIKGFTYKVFTFPFSEYVEKARNFALRKASGNWILILDPDETIPPYSEKIIRQLIKNKNYDGYMFPRRNYISEKKFLEYGYFYPDYQLRLFRNKKEIKYSGRIHEQVIINPNKVKNVNNLEIYHNYSHSKYNSFFSFSRSLRYIKIEAINKAQSNNTNTQLLLDILVELFRNFYRSFIKLKGYKDLYSGFRAAVLYSFYKAFIPLYSLLIRSKNEIHHL